MAEKGRLLRYVLRVAELYLAGALNFACKNVIRPSMIPPARSTRLDPRNGPRVN